MLRPLTIGDPAFYGGPTSPLAESDPDIYAWWKANKYLTSTSYIGDRSTKTTNKASLASPNMNLANGGSSLVFPRIADNDANFMAYSADLTFGTWAAVSGTKNSSTLFTFTASGGRVYQLARCDESGATYTFKFKIRRVGGIGNTNLAVYHANSATGTSTGIVITDVLTEMSVSFLGPPTAAIGGIDVGIQDNNGGGFGQIELTDMCVYRSDHDGNYLATTSSSIYGTRDGYPVWMTGYMNGVYEVWTTPSNRVLGPGAALTAYALVYPRNSIGSGYLMSNNGNTPLLAYNPTQRKLMCYNAGTDTDTNVFSLGAWQIWTWVVNGASSEFRINKAASTAFVSGTCSGSDWSITRNSSSYVTYIDLHEVILRQVADNTATQDEIIEYLADQVGLSV